MIIIEIFPIRLEQTPLPSPYINIKTLINPIQSPRTNISTANLSNRVLSNVIDSPRPARYNFINMNGKCGEHAIAEQLRLDAVVADLPYSSNGARWCARLAQCAHPNGRIRSCLHKFPTHSGRIRIIYISPHM